MDTTIVSSGKPGMGKKLMVVVRVEKGKFPDGGDCETITSVNNEIREARYDLEFSLADILSLETREEVQLSEDQVETVKQFVVKLAESFNVSDAAAIGAYFNPGSLIAIITIDGKKIGDLSLEKVLASI